MTRDVAIALTDAGYMTLADYINICKKNGWLI